MKQNIVGQISPLGSSPPSGMRGQGRRGHRLVSSRQGIEEAAMVEQRRDSERLGDPKEWKPHDASVGERTMRRCGMIDTR